MKHALTHGPIVVAFFLLGLLLLKNPFSERNLIANFDPFPDAFHYVTPPRCFLQGKEWRLCRPEFPGIKADVPPLYSLTFLPFFIVKNDPRMFYFANIVLSFTSLWFLYQILKKITKHPLIVGTVLFLYVTNYFVYWYPTLAMAENLILTLVLASLYLAQKNLQSYKPLTILLQAITAAAFYLTKPAYAPLTPLFLIWTMGVLFIHRRRFSPLVQKSAGLLTCLLFGGIIIQNWNSITWVVSSVVGNVELTELEQRSAWFGIFFWREHLPLYIKALFGTSIPFLWDHTPLVSWWVGLLGMTGLVVHTVSSKTRLFGGIVLAALWGQLLFIASFYALDARYIYHVIPLLLIGVAIFLEFVSKKIRAYPKRYAFIGVLALVIGAHFIAVMMPVKKQIMLNLRYAEQPWWYLSVKSIDSYFLSHPTPSDKKAYLIVAHPPYLFDYYAKGNYRLLPLTINQDFRNEKRALVWGELDYSDYLAMYTTLLKDGHPLYLTNYGLGNDKTYKHDFEAIQNTFKVTLLQEGCYNLCNVYRVELADEQ